MLSSTKELPRKIPRNPFKILEAPNIQDDFYLNLVDWSSQNFLAVGLSKSVYLWNAYTNRVHQLCEVSGFDSITSVCWNDQGSHLAVGTHLGSVQIWDVQHGKKTEEFEGHRSRVGVVAWNEKRVTSGSRDHMILNRDVRSPKDSVTRLKGHRQEVCGMKWSYDGKWLASGGNDNKLFIWDTASTSYVQKYGDHVAAVKAISWNPHQRGVLASGGGTADRCIRFWNVRDSEPLNSIDTGSQVCNLAWSKNINELVSTHGYSQNQVVVWKYPSMSQIATLTGHTMRVLYLAVAPDGQSIVTGAGDESLRFWNIFPSIKGIEPECSSH